MATYLDVERVQYVAASGVVAPLCRLYFCRHCLKLRSSDCVSHEVETHYCPNCLENVPSPEAKIKKNRCTSCFDCPSCHHTLSTRATSMSVTDPENPAKSTPKKVYYLACGFCRWTSRDIGIKDQTVASGGWAEKENIHTKRIQTLLDYYRQLAAKEKAEKEKKKYIRRRSYMHYSDKYGLGSIASRKRMGLMGNLSIKEGEDIKINEVEPSAASEDVEELNPDVFTKPVTLAKVTNISQRLADPAFQPSVTRDLYPIRKHMLMKRSQRCRECEHNLSKPEYNPSSIKFKIQLVALHHVPEVRIMSLPNFMPGQECQVLLSLLNPLDNLTHVTLLPTTDDDGLGTAQVSLPSCELVLSPRDDAAEFDDTLASQQNFKDDPSVVAFRKANKLGFFVKVTPKEGSSEITITLRMKYDYHNLTTALQGETKQPPIEWIEHPVYIKLGTMAA